MDDQTNVPGNVPSGVPDMPAANPMGGSEPVVSQAPVAEEKCETCGNGSSNGNCVGCSVPNASCTCPPKVEGEEGVEPPAQPVM